MKLNPDHSDLKVPETFIDHIIQLTSPADPTPHFEVLERLLEQVEPVEFEKEAFPGSHDQEDSPKIKERHYLIIGIENILSLAKKNKWGLTRKYDFIYIFNGAYWAEVDRDTLQNFLGRAAEKMGVPKFSAKHFSFQERLFKQFLVTAHLTSPTRSPKTILFNLKNGTYEVSPEGRKLRPFNQIDFIPYQLPFDFNPEATAPIFQAYLNRVLPDESRQRVLGEYLGYVFTRKGPGIPKLEKSLVLYGSGANGKSVFFEVVNALLGPENCSSYSLQSITDSTGYYRAKLVNKLVNYASEINGKLEIDIFKRLVSGEPVEARLPYGQPHIIEDYAKLIFNCNELPREVEHTKAFFRRFLIIPFGVTIPEDEQDKNLHNRIISEELPGIFNWILEGLDRLLQQGGFSQCAAAESALIQYQVDSDSVLTFLNECGYQPSKREEKDRQDIFARYREFCFEEGFKPVSSRKFGERLKAAGYRVERRAYGRVVFIEKK